MGIRRLTTHNSNNNMIFSFVARPPAFTAVRSRYFAIAYLAFMRHQRAAHLCRLAQQQGTRSRHAGLRVSSLLSGACACMHVTYTRIIPTHVTYAQVHTGLHGAATAAMLHAADTDLLAIYNNIIASISRVYNT